MYFFSLYSTFHWVKNSSTECVDNNFVLSGFFMVENRDESQCNYFHWGYVFHIMIHHLLIKLGTFNPLTPLNLIPILRQWEIFFGWPPAGFMNNSSWNNERQGFTHLAVVLLYVALRLLLNIHTWPTLIAGPKWLMSNAIKKCECSNQILMTKYNNNLLQD